jgi:hypothetical protein
MEALSFTATGIAPDFNRTSLLILRLRRKNQIHCKSAGFIFIHQIFQCTMVVEKIKAAVEAAFKEVVPISLFICFPAFSHYLMKNIMCCCDQFG